MNPPCSFLILRLNQSRLKIYTIDNPALAYPTTEFTNVTPVADAENTSSKRVCAVTAIFSPVVIPLLILPIEISPVNAGARVTIAPGIGEKILFGVVDWYICAWMVTVLPTSVSASVVLKYALNAVIVPALGTENAKLVNVPAAFVKSIVAPNTPTDGADAPNPIRLGIPTSPPAMVVIVIGIPDENGIIAPPPFNPAAPVAPVAPAAPAAPVAPVAPVAT